MKHRHAAAVVVACMLGGTGGCSDSTTPDPPNVLPDVWIASGLPDGSLRPYRVHVFWGGWDPDGDVLYYEYAVDDLPPGQEPAAARAQARTWTRVDLNDGELVFSADVLFDSAGLDEETLEPLEYRRGHRFLIRAVDNRDGRSSPPAQRSFTSFNYSPVVSIIAPAAVGSVLVSVPDGFTTSWSGTDYVTSVNEIQLPEASRFALVPVAQFSGWEGAVAHIRANTAALEWSEWMAYNAPDGSGRSWTLPELADGEYMFAVQVRDEAGAVSATFDLRRNIRRIQIGP